MNPQKTYEKAIRLHQTGNYGKAVKLYKELARLFPNQDAIYTNLGTALISLGNLREAGNYLEKAIQLNTNNVDTLAAMGSLASMQTQPQKAIRSFQAALQIAPQRSDLHYNLANLFLKTGNIKKAESCYQKAIQYNPAFAQAHFNLGNIYSQKKDTVAAKKAFQKTIQLQADFDGAYLNLAYIFMDEGNLAEAEKIFKQGLKVLPDHPKIIQALGRVKFELGQLKPALELLTDSLKSNPDDFETLVLMGNTCKELGQKGQAIHFYKKALEIEAENEGVLQNLRRLEAGSIPSWHFIMLADDLRNEAYEKALAKVVKDKIVLEIGAGSGLLSMMAAKHGAKSVFACEMVKTLAETAEMVVRDNGFEEKIKIIPKKSTDLTLGEDLPEKAEILVAEIFDVALLGEMVLPTFRHAKKFLLKENAIIIPSKARIWAMIVEMPERRKVNPIKQISGFDLSAFDRFRIPNDYIMVNLRADQYTALSEAFEVLSLDFYHPSSGIPDNSPLEKVIEVETTHFGNAHAIAFWFDLTLDDEIKVSSGIDGELKHWGQAAHFLNEDIPVEKGQMVSVKIAYTDNFVRFSI